MLTGTSGLPAEKPCSKCAHTLPLDSFARAKQGKYGRLSVCRACVHERYYIGREAAMMRGRARRLDPAKRAREAERQRARRNTNRLGRLIQEANVRGRHLGVPASLKPGDLALPATCPVLGIPIVVGSKMCDSSPSIDRIVPSKGYVPGNVVVVSWRANRLRVNATISELEKILAFYKANGAP